MSTSSPFSFHCMICFDEFDTQVSYPVVLLCGHTYICAVCAQKLDRCPECRTDLFISQVVANPSPEAGLTSPSQTRPPTARERAVAARQNIRRTNNYSPRQIPKEVPKVQKSRAPAPKNIVLLSLMDATNLVSERAENFSCCEGPSNETLKCNSGSSDQSGEEYELEKIKMSTSIAAGTCGTYAVAAKNGLVIAPSPPSSDNNTNNFKQGIPLTHSISSPKWERDMDEIIVKAGKNGHSPLRKASKGKHMTFNTSPKKDKIKSDSEMFLNEGDRVQVVTIENGWAKLARGYGFVQCGSNNDLVKVGGVVDKACSIEACLHFHALQRNELRREQARVDRDAVALMNEFQLALKTEEDLTVICAEAFSSNVSIIINNPITMSSQLATSDVLDKTPQNNSEEDHGLRKPQKKTLVSSSSKKDKNQSGNIMMSFATRIFGKDLINFQYQGQNVEETSTAIMSSVTHKTTPSQAMSAGAENWRKKNGREPARYINFRTGMSGHLAVLSHNANRPAEQSGRHRPLRMSQHSALCLPSRKKP